MRFNVTLFKWLICVLIVGNILFFLRKFVWLLKIGITDFTGALTNVYYLQFIGVSVFVCLVAAVTVNEGGVIIRLSLQTLKLILIVSVCLLYIFGILTFNSNHSDAEVNTGAIGSLYMSGRVPINVQLYPEWDSRTNEGTLLTKTENIHVKNVYVYSESPMDVNFSGFTVLNTTSDLMGRQLNLNVGNSYYQYSVYEKGRANTIPEIQQKVNLEQRHDKLVLITPSSKGFIYCVAKNI